MAIDTENVPKTASMEQVRIFMVHVVSGALLLIEGKRQGRLEANHSLHPAVKECQRVLDALHNAKSAEKIGRAAKAAKALLEDHRRLPEMEKFYVPLKYIADRHRTGTLGDIPTTYLEYCLSTQL